MPRTAAIVVTGIALLVVIGAARCDKRSGPDALPAAPIVRPAGPPLAIPVAYLAAIAKPTPAAPVTVEPSAEAPAKTAEPETVSVVQPPARPVLVFGNGPSIVRPASTAHAPVLADVISRLPDPNYWRDQTAPNDLVTWTHEGSHGVCVRLPRVKGSHAIYLLDGKSIHIRHPKVTIGEVAASVPAKDRGRIFQLYMVEQRRDWDKEPIYIAEEWTCYIHGTLARRQYGIKLRSETESHSLEMERYCRAMLALAKRKDPTYPDAEKLAAFIEWNSARFREFQKVEPIRLAGEASNAVSR